MSAVRDKTDLVADKLNVFFGEGLSEPTSLPFSKAVPESTRLRLSERFHW